MINPIIIKLVMSVISLGCLAVSLATPNSATPLGLLPVIATVSAWSFYDSKQISMANSAGKYVKAFKRFFSFSKLFCIFVAVFLCFACAFVGLTYDVCTKNDMNDMIDSTTVDTINSIEDSNNSNDTEDVFYSNVFVDEYFIVPKDNNAFVIKGHIAYSYAKAAIIVFFLVSILVFLEISNSVTSYKISVYRQEINKRLSFDKRVETYLLK